jgi:hypothetical protein
MGHYDSCYEAEREEADKQKEKDIKSHFKILNNKLTIDDKKFLIKIMDNIEDYKALDRLLTNKRK